MERHTRTDSQGSGELQPRYIGDRLKYGERTAGEIHLADQWRTRPERAYTYGASKVSLRPDVVDEEDEKPKPEPAPKPKPKPKYRTPPPLKPRRKRRRTVFVHRPVMHDQPQPAPLIPIVQEVRVSRNPPAHVHRDPRMTGEDIMKYLDE